MNFWSVLTMVIGLIAKISTEDLRLVDLPPEEAQQYIESKDQTLKYAPKIDSNVPAVRYLGNTPTNVLEDTYLANQYHGQDGLGGYLYGYSVPDIAKTEKKQAGGDLKGAYQYINDAGQEIKVQYWDDGTGFHQVDNLPEVLPKQVEDSPDVQAAKNEFFKRWHEEAERNSKPISGDAGQQYQPGQNVYDQYQTGQHTSNPQQISGTGTYQGQASYQTGQSIPGPIQSGETHYESGQGQPVQNQYQSGQYGSGQSQYQSNSGQPSENQHRSGQNQYHPGQNQQQSGQGYNQGQNLGHQPNSGVFGQTSTGTYQSGQPGQNQYQSNLGQSNQYQPGQGASSDQAGYQTSQTSSGCSGQGGNCQQSQPNQSGYPSGQSSYPSSQGQQGSHSGQSGCSTGNCQSNQSNYPSGQIQQGSYSGQSGCSTGNCQFSQNQRGQSSHQANEGSYSGQISCSGQGGNCQSNQIQPGQGGHQPNQGSYSQQTGCSTPGKCSGGQSTYIPSHGSHLNSGDYSGQSSNQQTWTNNQGGNDGEWKRTDEENGPPKGFFYNFDYPVGIIVQKQGEGTGSGGVHKRESLEQLYTQNKENFYHQVKNGASNGSSQGGYQVHA